MFAREGGSLTPVKGEVFSVYYAENHAMKKVFQNRGVAFCKLTKLNQNKQIQPNLTRALTFCNLIKLNEANLT